MRIISLFAERRLPMIGMTALSLAYLATVGCGKSPTAKAIYGSVACDGEKASQGRVMFVPLPPSAGANCAATIVDGQYRIDARGGLPPGKYSVRVDARKKTGRKVRGYNGMEMTMVDELVRMGPEVYAGEQSPLVVDVRADFDGRFDIAMPR